ncbi:serine/threonine protein kinase [Neodidymelliopsis sp. IMI 364377]|nr:serine/threonine protein kinase [Neodidymelliopsis sp. IMI 364377]
MSADLFAEFSTDSNTQSTPQLTGNTTNPASTFSFFNDLNTPATVPQPQPLTSQQGFGHTSSLPTQTSTDDDTDDWGDFEGGSSSAKPAPPGQQDPFAFVSEQHSRPVQQSWSSQSPAHDPFNFQTVHPPTVSQESWQRAPVIKAKKPTDSSVLFDAEEDLEDEDDFGDFEDSQPVAVISTPVGGPLAIADLLGDLDVSEPKPLVPSGKNRKAENPPVVAGSISRKSPVGGFGVASKPKQSKVTPTPTPQVADDGWDTFDDWEASIPASAPEKLKHPKSTPASTRLVPEPILSPAIGDIQPGELPPTNVPPPGVLLSLFPPLFTDAQEKLFKPMAAQTLPMRNKLLAEQGTIVYLQGYIVLASVATHIIAGRKLRWKRDQHLSQGMRIGPASSRATSGMKLAGIDKGENLKEEREVADVVRVWKDQIGRLRHVISGVNQIKAGTLGVAPDLQETMPVRLLKQSEGGIPARQPCMLCGLKRDERVSAADVAVDDSFGEWWIEQVNMHRGTSAL